MGVTILNALFLLHARREGAAFGSTMTLGRLDCFMAERDLRRIDAMLPPGSGFATAGTSRMDRFLTALGAGSIEVLDASAFEGASIIHDLNEPFPNELEDRFDAVIDTGTLEHVFNVPVAFRNVMSSLKVGGSFIAALPADGWCGHGLYQFGPDFFYRVFSQEHGFDVVSLLVAPAYDAGRWLDGPAFRVADPATLRARVEIKARTETLLLLHARRIAKVAIFAKWPQQSDYARAWETADVPPRARSRISRWGWSVHRARGVGRLLQRAWRRWGWVRESNRNAGLQRHPWTP